MLSLDVLAIISHMLKNDLNLLSVQLLRPSHTIAQIYAKMLGTAIREKKTADREKLQIFWAPLTLTAKLCALKEGY